MGQVEIVETYEDLPEHEAFDCFLENDLDPIDDIQPLLGKSVANDYATHMYLTLK